MYYMLETMDDILILSEKEVSLADLPLIEIFDPELVITTKMGDTFKCIICY